MTNETEKLTDEMLCKLAVGSGAKYYKKHQDLLAEELKTNPDNKILSDIKRTIDAEKFVDNMLEWHAKCLDYCQSLPEEKRKDFEKRMNDAIENVNSGWKKALESTYKSGGDYSWLDTGLKPDDQD